jgi:hypothetical protein
MGKSICTREDVLKELRLVVHQSTTIDRRYEEDMDLVQSLVRRCRRLIAALEGGAEIPVVVYPRFPVQESFDGVLQAPMTKEALDEDIKFTVETELFQDADGLMWQLRFVPVWEVKR